MPRRIAQEAMEDDPKFFENFATSTTPAIDPSVHNLSVEEEIEAKLRRLRAISNDAERFYQVSILRGQIETMKRNIANGYNDALQRQNLHILEEVVRRTNVGPYGGMY